MPNTVAMSHARHIVKKHFFSAMNGKAPTLVLGVFAFVSVANAGLGFGRCPKGIQAMPNFTLDKYAGRWFEFSSFGTFFESNGKCVQASYIPQDDGTITVVNSMMNKRTQKLEFIRGSAELSDSSGEAKIAVTLPILGYFKNTAPLWVLGTDYGGYSLAYSCVDFFLFHYDSAWLLGRKSALGDTQLNKADKIMRKNGLHPLWFQLQEQDCGIIDCDSGDCQQKDEKLFNTTYI